MNHSSSALAASNIQHTYTIPFFPKLIWSTLCCVSAAAFTALPFEHRVRIVNILFMGAFALPFAIAGVYVLTVRISIDPDAVTQSWAWGSKAVAIKDIVEFGTDVHTSNTGLNIWYLRVITNMKTFKFMLFFPFDYVKKVGMEIQRYPKLKGNRKTSYHGIGDI